MIQFTLSIVKNMSYVGTQHIKAQPNANTAFVATICITGAPAVGAAPALANIARLELGAFTTFQHTSCGNYAANKHART